MARNSSPRSRTASSARRSFIPRNPATAAPHCYRTGWPRCDPSAAVALRGPGYSMTFVILPAVDVADGAAVRLVQGAAGTETSYGEPLEAALAWQRDGAEWLHLVDLDAAFIRDDTSLDSALATGAARVNLGTAALESPDWVRSAIARHGDRIAVGLDVRGTTLAARGWTQEGGDLWETMARLDADGCARYVVTFFYNDTATT